MSCVYRSLFLFVQIQILARGEYNYEVPVWKLYQNDSNPAFLSVSERTDISNNNIIRHTGNNT